jgi:hypothetical protein
MTSDIRGFCVVTPASRLLRVATLLDMTHDGLTALMHVPGWRPGESRAAPRLFLYLALTSPERPTEGTHMTIGVGNIVALICIIISVVFAVVTNQATSAVWWALLAIFAVLWWGARAPWGSR